MESKAENSRDCFTLRRATAADRPAIRELAWQTFPATYRSILTPAQISYMMKWMYSEDSLRRQMEEEGHIFLLACEGGIPAGYVSVQPQGGHVFHLQKIYVHPSFQGRHCGSFLFRAAVGLVKEMHPAPCRLELNVNRSNKARDFYRHMGMRIQREGDFPIGGGFYMNDYIMEMEL